MKNIDGIWFGGEGVWKPIDQLISGGTIVGQTIDGTSGDDLLSGTAGDDIINGHAGFDMILGTRGDDQIFGGGDEYDQVNYDAKKSDFIFTQEADGSVTATSDAFGIDALHDIDGIWFDDDEEWYAIDSLVG